MKKKFLILASLLVMGATRLFAAGYPVFDISGWLTALDQLYSQYDMVMNTVTQIENQYRQIQQAVERAKSIDWENIRFDGDFDIRNDIRDANKRVNSLLNQARRIQDTITTPSINCGKGQYSLADLCGAGSSDRNFFTAVTDMGDFMTQSMRNTITNIEEGLSEKQKQAIWHKYGISPKNYLFVQQSVANIKTGAAKVMAKATDEAVELQAETRMAKTNAIIEAAYSQTDSEGNMTEGAVNEATLYLNQQMIDELLELQRDINDMASLTASKMISEENEKQALASEKEEERKQHEAMEKKVPNYFRK